MEAQSEQQSRGEEESIPLVAEITITMFKDGTVNVRGPLEDRLLCYGLLEGARDVVREFRTDKRISIDESSFGPANIIIGRRG